MGIDWEELLGAGGKDLDRAYNDAIPEPDPYFYGDDEYEEAEGGKSEEQAIDPAILLNTPLFELTDAQKKAAFNVAYDGTPYLLAVLKGDINFWHGSDKTLKGIDDREYPACDRLFHANSVKTSIQFIRQCAIHINNQIEIFFFRLEKDHVADIIQDRAQVIFTLHDIDPACFNL